MVQRDMIKYFLSLTLLLAQGLSSPIVREDSNPCQVCHPVDPNKINVHLIPHSHDDVGWLKTVDQYYYGSHAEIQSAGVQYIISSTLEALKLDPNRRFVQVETAFLWKWWQNQKESIRQDFVNLVNSGQLEIINAAWSMNDEAATNYQSIIDQFTLGLRVINETIGRCGVPRIGWQIDPFGHSREQASIFAQLGFDGVFFARIDDNDREQRRFTKNMELIWKGSANSDNNNIFTSVFPEFYYPPANFCFDVWCGDEVINDDESSPEYNLPKRVDDFQSKIESLAAYYQTNNILIPMGGDFQYQSAEVNFINMDKLIAGFENNDDVNLIYSTPSCYIQAVNDEAKDKEIEFSVKTDDFFPYGSGNHCYWTGYFTSRPNAKRFERVANNVLQAAKQLASFAKSNGDDYDDSLLLLKQAVGILQHHDAITGTAKQAVAKDYSRVLSTGINALEPNLDLIVTDLLRKDSAPDINLSLKTCLLANVSVCEPATSQRFVVTVYNPLERPVDYYVRIPVPDGTYRITGPEGEVASDLLDPIDSFDYLDGVVGTTNPKELVFAADGLPGFGIRLFYVERTSSASEAKEPSPKLQFGSESTGFEIDDQTGLLKSVTINSQTIPITQQFLYYRGSKGDDDDGQTSGAYILRPLENNATVASSSVTVTSTTGNLVDEVRQEVNDWITQIIRVYKGGNDNYIEFDWLVGPIDVDAETGIGREIISRFTVGDFDNQQTFYTDSNGRELIKRELNKRYDYQYDASQEPVASNYYPVTSKIVIRDEDKKLEVAVLNDRAQGGSSLKNGQIELMVHRRLLVDDDKGVDEALNDTEFDDGVRARGQFYLVAGSTSSSNTSIAAQERDLALKKLLSPLVLVGDASSDDLSLEDVQTALNFNFEGLSSSLPDNVHILTLEPWSDDAFVLRLEHILEKGEDSLLSGSVTVNLANLFTLFEITEIRETTLGANQWLDEFQAREKFVWNTKGGGTSSNKSRATPKAAELEVSLDPMQIRTFIIRVSRL